MKITMKTMLAFVAGSIALSACSDDAIIDENNNSNGSAKGTITFTATTGEEEGEATRASLNGLEIVWNKGDEISVFSGADLKTNNKMTLTSGAGTTSASFSGNCAKGQQYFAIYPYSAEHSAKDYYNLGCKIAWNCVEQIAVKGSFDPSVPMIAMASNVSETATSVPLQFRNIYAFVKVTTDYKCKSITLRSNQGSIASIFRYVSFDNDGNPNPTYESSTQSKVIILRGKDGAAIEAGTYYIAVHPTTLSNGFELTFTSAYDETKKYTKSTTKNVTFTAGKVLNLGSFTLRDNLETLEGAGTPENPYKINDFDDLKTFQRWITAEKGETWKKSYLQTADIDAQGQKMAPIGTAEHRFWGTYDGGNHSIKNLCIKGTVEYKIPTSISETNRACALFGAIRGATIKNLTIENPSFDSSNKGSHLTVSPLVGVAYSADANYNTNRCKILNCQLTGSCTIDNIGNTDGMSLSFSSDYGFIYGGFVGCSQCNLEITECSTDMALTASYGGNNVGIYYNTCVGGFIGLAYGVNEKNSASLEHDGDVVINKCRNNSPKISYTIERKVGLAAVGGFIGIAEEISTDNDVRCILKNCINNADIYSTFNIANTYIGGLIGINDSNGYSGADPLITNCINNGNFQCFGQYDQVGLGGILGGSWDNSIKITNCANTGSAYTEDVRSNGLALYAISLDGTLSDCWTIQEAGSLNITKCGNHLTIREIELHMNASSVVDGTNYYMWKILTTSTGRQILDLSFR